MKIRVEKEISITTKDGVTVPRRRGELLSVSHVVGLRWIRRRFATWVCAEDDDPFWEPAPGLRAVIPHTDRMIRSAPNK